MMNLKGKKKQLAIIGVVLALIIAAVAIIPSIKPKTQADGGQSYTSTIANQQSDIQDGVTLHCWNWSYKNIEANMELIAEQGFSAIQTSPIQQAKEGTLGRGVGSNWWVYYQPMGFHIDNSGQSALGTKAEFESMCAKAHEYGIKVIVDVVANHLGNQTGNNIANTAIPELKNDSSCWHNIYVNTSNFSDRYDITQHCMSGLPDLNTGSDKVQNYVLGFLKECIDSGADGFRFDAAKHIETPDDGSSNCASDFWPTVIYGATEYATNTRGIDLYCYGEILDQPDSAGRLPVSAYTKYMSITDNQQGNNLRNYVNSRNAAGAGNSYFCKDTTADKLVLWAESHDTYADKSSMGVSTEVINKTWALVAARADAMGLYFARPYSTSSMLGDADATGWAYAEVGAVNRFHNDFVGTSEYMSSENGIAYCERGDSGVVLVNCNGTYTNVNVSAHTMKNGTYIDQVSGGTFTVSNGRITGNIGNTGIAVVYNVSKAPVISVSREGGSFTSETITLNVSVANADSATYQVGNSAVVTFYNSADVIVGKDMSYGDSVDVKITATAGGETVMKTYTFNKIEKSDNVAYIELPSGWGTNVYCYVYDNATDNVNNGAWPGVAMTHVSGNLYMYEVPENIIEPRVIFYSSDSCRYPQDMAPGVLLTGSMIFADGSWKAYVPEVITYGKVVAEYVDVDGAQIAEAVTKEGQTGTNYTTEAKNVEGYTLSKTVGNAQGTFTDGTVTVQYVYTKNPVAESRTAYIKLPAGWSSTVYCYAYSEETGANNGGWPGVKMTKEANGLYSCEVSGSITNPLVIFTDGKNQYPVAMQPGLSLDKDMVYENGTWKEYTEVVNTANIAYIQKESWWGNTLYCYAYSDDNGATNGGWPGVKMTKVSGNIYSYEVPANITNPRVIFTDGNNQYPGPMESGLSLTGSMIYKNGSWNSYN